MTVRLKTVCPSMSEFKGWTSSHDEALWWMARTSFPNLATESASLEDSESMALTPESAESSCEMGRSASSFVKAIFASANGTYSRSKKRTENEFLVGLSKNGFGTEMSWDRSEVALPATNGSPQYSLSGAVGNSMDADRFSMYVLLSSHQPVVEE